MQKVDREIRRALTKAGYEVVKQTRTNGHTKITIRLPTGEQRTITTASTPKNMDHTIAAVLRDARRSPTTA